MASSVATVETTSATANANPCSRNNPRYCTTPTPAGTNKSGKAASSPLAAWPRSLAARASSIERPPALVKAKRNDKQREPDHRAGRRQRKPARRDLADELKCKEDEKAADHADLSPEAGGEVNANAYAPAMIDFKRHAPGEGREAL